MDIASLQQRLREFTAERDWNQFHSPKNLAMALTSEAGELAEVFQWMTEQQSRDLGKSGADQARAREEIADVMIYLLRLAEVLRIDLEEARGGPRNSDSLLRWDPDQGEGVWNATEATELSC